MNKKIKVLISTHPFGTADPRAAEMLASQGWEIEFNPYGRKIGLDELKPFLPEVDALIAGTEGMNEDALKFADNLKLISRVGIGLDGLDWAAIKKRNIEVAYTPDAPSLSVAELVIGLMINLTRGINISNSCMHSKKWYRYMGSELSEKTIGVIGLGRVGKKVAQLLKPFNCRIIVNDIEPDLKFAEEYGLNLVEKEEIYEKSDIVTLHVPLTSLTKNLINENAFKKMRHDAFVINTSRGSVIDEISLYNALAANKIKGAAIDVYNEEPYKGCLVGLDNIILTSHMGSCTDESRKAMEIGAAEAVVDFFKGRKLKNRVPDELRNNEA